MSECVCVKESVYICYFFLKKLNFPSKKKPEKRSGRILLASKRSFFRLPYLKNFKKILNYSFCFKNTIHFQEAAASAIFFRESLQKCSAVTERRSKITEEPKLNQILAWVNPATTYPIKQQNATVQA